MLMLVYISIYLFLVFLAILCVNCQLIITLVLFITIMITYVECVMHNIYIRFIIMCPVS